jgi:hypothetical protein
LKPFNIGLSGNTTDDDSKITQDNDGNLAMFEEDEGDKEDEEQADEVDDNDNDNDNIDELQELSEDK